MAQPASGTGTRGRKPSDAGVEQTNSVKKGKPGRKPTPTSKGPQKLVSE